MISFDSVSSYVAIFIPDGNTDSVGEIEMGYAISDDITGLTAISALQ